MASETKLNGALLYMVITAALTAVVGLVGFAFAFDRLRDLGGKYVIAVGFITVWSLVFVVMTLLRARATPMVAGGGLALWIAYRFCVAVVTGSWPLIVDLLGEVVLVAGFCGYMASGALPNTYYRRRLPVP
jgi:hypothetical protein